VTPLGRPVANTELYVLDRRAEPLPVGVPGELFIGGEGVARGYAGRPDLTAERFLPDPFGRRPGARLYRTGDLVRRLPDGTLEFLGRIDNQVKVRGFRIELGEVEAALLEQDAVRAAVVLARDGGAPDRQLVAHVVFGSGEAPTITQLRARLRETLPSYMVPSSFVVLDSLPLTPNGKVDRRALARMAEAQRGDEDGCVEPRTPLERRIAEAWKDALGVGRVSVHDNFFDVGGHSLLSMRVLARLEKELGVRLSPRELVFQTLGQLAAMLEEGRSPVAGERGRRA
jgi:acyl carrier protein